MMQIENLGRRCIARAGRIRAVAEARLVGRKATVGGLYPLTMMRVEGDWLACTDGGVLFGLRGDWGPTGVYEYEDAVKDELRGGAKPVENVRFPDWQALVAELDRDEDNVTEVVIDDLAVTLRRVQQAGIMAPEKNRGVFVVCNTDGSLGFAAVDWEHGHAEINVQPGGQVAGMWEMGRMRAAIQFMARCGWGLTRVYLHGPERPMVLRDSDGGAIAVVAGKQWTALYEGLEAALRG